MKQFDIKYNVGKAKYLVSYHNGVKKHKDGSDFFDAKILKSKKALNVFVSELITSGYKPSH